MLMLFSQCVSGTIMAEESDGSPCILLYDSKNCFGFGANR